MTTRKRTVVASSLLALLVGSIGVACGSDTAEMPAIPDGSAPTSTTPPPPPPVEAGGDAADGGELVGLPPPEPPKPNELTDPFGVFVSKGAPDGGDGTRAKPFNTISAGLEQAATDKKRLYVCAGTYPEAIELKNGVSVIANLSCVDPLDWKLNGARTTINAPTSPAVTANSITAATRVDGLEIFAPAGTASEPSSIGLLAVNSPGLTFTEGKLEASRGYDGANGVPATPARVSMETAPQARAESAPCVNSIVIPARPCTRVNPPTRLGGEGGQYLCTADVLIGGSTGGAGGASGVYEGTTILVTATIGGAGRPATSTPGTDGTSSTGGTFSPSGFAVGGGTAGTNGSFGVAGSGGGKPFNGNGEVPPNTATIMWGPTGAGGGAGGCPGRAGSAGGGGGASVGALLLSSPVRFEKVALKSDVGGRGGFGTFGTLPTPGQAQAGPPRDQGGTVCLACASPGSAGSRAGFSGHGAGGPSIAVVSSSSARPTFVDSTLAHGPAGISPPATTENGLTIPAPATAVAADRFDL